MSAQKKLTDSDLNDILSKVNDVNRKQQTGELSLEDALNEARAARKLMADTLDRSLEKQPEFRVKVWNEVKGLVSALEAEKFEEDRLRGAKFGPDAILDIEARTKIQDVKRIINSMTINGRKKLTKEEERYFEGQTRDDGTVSDEQHALVRLTMLNDYGKYIDTDHPEMAKLRQRYHDRTLDNYEGYAKSQFRKTNRDKALFEKVADGIKNNRYSNPEKARAVANALQPIMPDSEAQ